MSRNRIHTVPKCHGSGSLQKCHRSGSIPKCHVSGTMVLSLRWQSDALHTWLDLIHYIGSHSSINELQLVYVYYDVQMCGLRPVGAEQGGPRHLHRGRFRQERLVTGSM